MSLAGKTAVITGSNSGIGLGIAREMAKAGVNVVLKALTTTRWRLELQRNSVLRQNTSRLICQNLTIAAA